MQCRFDVVVVVPTMTYTALNYYTLFASLLNFYPIKLASKLSVN